MIGAIARHHRSVYEWNNIKTMNELFPGAVYRRFGVNGMLADTILTGRPYVENLRAFYRLYPGAGYGEL
jgi:hypothetical protein